MTQITYKSTASSYKLFYFPESIHQYRRLLVNHHIVYLFLLRRGGRSVGRILQKLCWSISADWVGVLRGLKNSITKCFDCSLRFTYTNHLLLFHLLYFDPHSINVVIHAKKASFDTHTILSFIHPNHNFSSFFALGFYLLSPPPPSPLPSTIPFHFRNQCVS